MYYLQSRYYDPEVGRFVNSDTLLVSDSVLGFNLFAYCCNNPVMGIDPNGEWDIGTFLSGAALVVTGVTAVLVAAPIIACASAGAVITAVAAVTAYTGALTVVNGVAELGESVSGYNLVRDGMLGGNAEAYSTYRNVTSTVAQLGTMVCGAYTAARGGNVCFVAGTLVLVELSEKLIENIEPGDKVWAWNEETGQTELKTVVETYENETTELTHVFVGGKEIISTPSHPFYSPVKGWTAACKLRAGDILVTVNGEYVVVEQVQHELIESPVKVYNIQVEDDHTYYVSDTGVLVHNSCNSYRENAKRYYETDAVGQDAHHIYPQKFSDYFRNLNINIHAPENNEFVESHIHRATSYAYNKLWEEFIKNNPGATASQVKNIAQEFMKIMR